MKVGTIVTASVVGLFIIIVVLMGIGYKNTEIELRNQSVAQQKANTVIFDKTWKVISQNVGIANEYKKAFKEVYSELFGIREGDDNPAFKWIHEQNPTFSTELYKELGDSISGLRAEFAMVQNRLVDIKREHNNLLQRIPSRWFVGGKEPLEITIVTSTKTEEIFESGKEEDVKLF